MRKLTTQEFINKSKKVHGDKYDYTLVDYKNNSTKVIIICLSCGDEISINPSHHLRGQGCRKCNTKRFADRTRKSSDQFISESNVIHNNKYDYSLVDYKGHHNKVKIKCPIHGWFEQTPSNHLHYGCNKCGYDSSSINQTNNQQYYIDRAREIHDDRYEYKLSPDQTHSDKVQIICPIHGVFEQKLGNHIYKQYGCPKCASHISRQEIELQKWLSQYIDIKTNDRNIINPLELDIVIPTKKIAIEYNGIYWHSESMDKDRNYHLNKYNICKEKGYRLIQIWENEWVNNKDIVKSIILSAIGVYDQKIHGRKCEIRDVNSIDSRKFYDNNHIQGFQSGVHHGLYYKNELVSLLTVKYYVKNPVLERFVNKKNTLVHGAFSKLLKSFDNIDGMITFSDPRYFTGGVYEHNGFDKCPDVKPNYWYFKNGSLIVYHRRRFQKKMIEDKYNKGFIKYFDINKTEYENMLANNYHRIWDCGNLKYVFKV